MFNRFNFKQLEDKYLITNDAGYYSFLSPQELMALVVKPRELSMKKIEELVNKEFLYFGEKEEFIENAFPNVRSFKNHLFSSTSLHIFVVTTQCNQNCVYCQASVCNDKSSNMMSFNTARKAVDIAFCSKEKLICIEFQGGEPLLNFPVIEYITKYAESIKGDRVVEYNIVSNLLLLNDDIIDFFKIYRFNVSTSLDGNEFLHNKNRPAFGENVFKVLNDSITKIRQAELPFNAIQTTTKHSLKFSKEIIDTYLDLGFNGVFIRPLTKLGYAEKNWNSIGYSSDEFLRFYEDTLIYIIELGKRGIIVKENFAGIFLKKIINRESVNYMELRSPCGATIGQLAYYYDGNVYTCDEGRMLGEMGDSSFCFGNVDNISYNDILNSNICNAVCSASCLEAIPFCSDCAYQPYCGVCPVVNYSETNSIFSQVPADYRCKIHMGIQDILFKLLKNGDEATQQALLNCCS